MGGGAHTTFGSPETCDETLGLGQRVLLPEDNEAVVSPLVCLSALATKILIIQIFLLNYCNFFNKVLSIFLLPLSSIHDFILLFWLHLLKNFNFPELLL